MGGVVVVSVLAILLPFAKAANLPEELLTMPIYLTTGEVVTLKQYQGKKPVYLKFWATWCKPCLKQMPHFEEVNQQYGNDLVVIAINLGMNDDITALTKVQKEFNLSMSMAIDKSGDLAQGFRLLGTPYHLLFDKQMNLVHIGHEADESIDNKIALVTRGKEIDLLANNVITASEAPLKLNLEDDKVHALFFSATWCDWYHQDLRPEVAKQCILAQKSVNKFSQKYESIAWQGVISRLWTGQAELSNYIKKYQIKHPIAIDVSNSLFHQYEIKDLPSLVIVKEGKVILKTSDFSDQESLLKQLSVL